MVKRVTNSSFSKYDHVLHLNTLQRGEEQGNRIPRQRWYAESKVRQECVSVHAVRSITFWQSSKLAVEYSAVEVSCASHAFERLGYMNSIIDIHQAHDGEKFNKIFWWGKTGSTKKRMRLKMGVYGLSYTMTVWVGSTVRLTSNIIGRKWRLRFPHEVVKLTYGPRQNCKMKRYFVKLRSWLNGSANQYWFRTGLIVLTVEICRQCYKLLSWKTQVLGLWRLKMIFLVSKRLEGAILKQKDCWKGFS